MKKVATKKAAPKKTVGKSSKSLRRAPASKASTIRLQPELQSALDEISGHLGRPKNKLVNQAVAEFLEKTTFRLRDDLEGTLEKLRAYRRRDPDYEAEIERFVLAESSLSAGDAFEGKARSASDQTLAKEIHDLIHA